MQKKKKIKVRKSWPKGFSPVQKVVPSEKIYKRRNLTPKELHDYYGIE